jgi:hypothetical protein
MKNFYINNMKRLFTASLVTLIVFAGCQRSTDGLSEPTLSNNPEVYMDGFSAGLEYFPFDYSKLDAFQVDTDVTYNETKASMRIDVPNPEALEDEGRYAGATFVDLSGGRNLSEYDALTFYAKGSKASRINEIGFGVGADSDKFKVKLDSLRLSTFWQKFTIPIPDPSKLTAESGLFWFAENPEDGDGYSFWVDELQFENLGTIAQPRPFINDGIDTQVFSSVNLTSNITGFSFIANTIVELPDETTVSQDVQLNVSPSYFDFQTSNSSVATVDELGVITMVGEGSATITATLGGTQALGSIEVSVDPPFQTAPVPTVNADSVISIFSDAYTNVDVDYYNGFFNDDGQTTQGGTGFDGGPRGADIVVNGDGIINYTDLNFVGIGTFLNVSPVDASEMTHIHVDIYVNETVDANDFIKLELLNAVDTDDQASGSVTFNSSTLVEGEWVSLDIPIGDFGLTDRSALGLIFFVSDETISDIYVDNIYYYDDGSDVVEKTAPSIPITFDDSSVNYSATTFNGTAYEVVANPDVSGSNNTASNVGSITNIGQNWEGIFIDLENNLDFSNGTTITMDVYSTAALPVLLKIEEEGGAAVETTVSHGGTGWENLTFNFSSSASFPRVTIFIDGPGTATGTFYIDNIEQE